MSQEELASRLNVVRQTVSKWEKGLSMPDADMLVTLSDVFGVSVAELLGEEAANEGSESVRKFEKRGSGIMKVVVRVALGVLISYLIFMIIQTIFGLVVSVNTEISADAVPIFY